jgi:hypothetical protein
VTQKGDGRWRLLVPPGEEGFYRLAQLDDYAERRRVDFFWEPGLTLSLKARVSGENLPGTWGFGLWNDPFSLSLGFGGGTRRFPALPNTAWFFYSAPNNYLSFRDDTPAQGFLAQTFNAPTIPSLLLALSLVGTPLLAWPWMARVLRPMFSQIIKEAGCMIRIDVREWHMYTLKWQGNRVSFQADGEDLFETGVSPNGPLGLVLWIDNQYAAFPPDGRLSYGTLSNSESAWLEIEGLKIERGA